MLRTKYTMSDFKGRALTDFIKLQLMKYYRFDRQFTLVVSECINNADITALSDKLLVEVEIKISNLIDDEIGEGMRDDLVIRSSARRRPGHGPVSRDVRNPGIAAAVRGLGRRIVQIDLGGETVQGVSLAVTEHDLRECRPQHRQGEFDIFRADDIVSAGGNFPALQGGDTFLDHFICREQDAQAPEADGAGIRIIEFDPPLFPDAGRRGNFIDDHPIHIIEGAGIVFRLLVASCRKEKGQGEGNQDTTRKVVLHNSAGYNNP